jgi:rhodanese-related sulfurtransferase
MEKVGITLIIFFISYSLNASETFDQMATKMASSFKVPIITNDKLVELFKDKKLVILDTREKKEYKVSHIEGAIHVGFDDFNLTRVLAKIKKDSVVVSYCSVGYRSGDITSRLKKIGVDAYNLYGGIFLWNNLGKKLYSSPGIKTKKIHGYNKEWGKWIHSGEIVY